MFLTVSQAPGKAPTRIVSLVPSQTELLHYLQLESETVGITKFCLHPQNWYLHKARIGGTKTVDIEKVKDLKPDLIIANKEENVQEQVEMLAELYPVWVTDVNNLQDALQMIDDIGHLTQRPTQAATLIKTIDEKFISLKRNIARTPRLRVCYLIWKDPYMTVGSGNFINDMLQKAGFKNAFAASTRYPAISLQDIRDSGCELLLLSSEPYPFKEKHIQELQAALPAIKIALADGEMFSWYGSRLLEAPGYFEKLRQQIFK